MAKHNYYPETLKIQIVERLLSGKSGSSLREEFNIQVEEQYIGGNSGT